MAKSWSSKSFVYGMIFTAALVAAATCSTAIKSAQEGGTSAASTTQAAATASRIRIPEYMSADLRARVEKLKTDLAAAASTPETADARALVLFDWMNAYAMTGRFLPVNMASSITQIALPSPATRAQCAQVDSFIRELTLYEEEPDALGSVAADNAGPFEAGTWQTLVQTYTVGSRPVPKGGGVLLGRHFQSNQGVYQTRDPSGDNYVSVRASNPAVRMRASVAPLAGMFGGFRGSQEMPFFEVMEGELKPGDKVVVTIGDKSGGGRGFRMQSFANDGLRNPLYVSYGPGTQLMSLKPVLFSVSGGPVARVRGFAPSTASVGETVTVSVRGEDRWRNRATGPQPSYDVMVNGERVARVAAGDRAITLLDTLKFDKPGVYRLSFRSDDGGITGDANPIWVREGKQAGIYWGETHAHSAFAEGQGSIDFFYTFGRDDARLDFLGMSEHDTWMDDWEWEQLRSAAKRYDKPGEFVPFLAYEWTAVTTFGGHHNVFFRTAEGRQRTPIQTNPTLTQLYEGLKKRNDPKDVLVIPHAHQTGEYRISDADVENLVEVLSLHGAFEWFGQKYLEQGHEVGFIAASDDHLSHPGYAAANGGLGYRSGLAAVLAPEKSRDAIFDGLKARRTYATSGERIILDYDVSGGGFGQRIAMTDKRTVKLRAIGTAPIREITIVKNGRDVFTQDYLADPTGKSNRIAVEFFSATDPQIRDNARGWRRWEGTLTVKGARMDGFSAPGFTPSISDKVERSDKPGVLNLDFGTRGATQTVYLDLAGVSAGATIEIDVRAVRETGTPLEVATFHDYPATKVSLPLAKMKQGIFAVETAGAVTADRISIRTVRKDAPMDQSVEWTDPAPGLPDDTYYVRVVQADEARAFTSPVWVGGFSRKTQ